MEVWQLAIAGILSSSWKWSTSSLILLAIFTELAISLLAPGGHSHMKVTGMLVGKLELTP